MRPHLPEAAAQAPRLRAFTALAGGAALVFAFPNPLDPGLQAWPAALAWAGLLPLLWLAWGQTLQRAFRDGFLFGFAFFLISLVYLNNVRPMGPGAFPAWVLLSAWCALYPAFFALAVSEGSRRGWPAPLVWVPAAWTLAELLRERLLTGYPWVSLGSSQWSNAALLPLAGATGPAGLHYTVAFGNAVIYTLFFRPELLKGLARWSQAALTVLALGGLLVAAKRTAPQPDLSRPPLRAAVLQGNIDQDQPWTLEYRRRLMAVYLSLMDQARAKGAQLMVWPESAYPGFYNEGALEAEQLEAYARRHGLHLVLGATWALGDRGPYENAAVHVAPSGEAERYAKRRLVPFGEFIPLRKLVPPLDQALARLGLIDFVPGPAPARFDIQGLKAAPLVCYESLYARLARDGGPADVLVVVTLDTWFGRSAAPYHHASQACLRAVENGAWVARAAATGVSAFVDPAGRLLATQALDSTGFLIQDLQPMQGQTLYQRWGGWWNIVCLFGFLACAIGRKRQK